MYKLRVPITAIIALIALAPLCTAVECPENFVDVGGQCFHFLYNVETSYLASMDICDNLGGRLAVLDDCSLFGDIVSMIKDDSLLRGVNYWIGGNNIVDGVDFKWVDGSLVKMGAPFWGLISNETEEPSNNYDENCIFLNREGMYYMNDRFCAEEKVGPDISPLCQHPLDQGGCPYPYVELEGSCFQFISTLGENWEDSRTICQSSGGDLAILDDCELFEAIINYVVDNANLEPVYGYWIGGYRSYYTLQFQWVNEQYVALGAPYWGRSGDESTFTTGQPDNAGGNENCMELWADGGYYFNDADCKLEKAALCQANEITTTTKRPSTTTTRPPSTTTTLPPTTTTYTVKKNWVK